MAGIWIVCAIIGGLVGWCVADYASNYASNKKLHAMEDELERTVNECDSMMAAMRKSAVKFRHERDELKKRGHRR